MMRRLLLFLCLCSGLAVAANGVFEIARWTKERALVPQVANSGAKAATAEYALVELDDHVYAGAQASLADVRIVNAKQEAVPATILINALQSGQTAQLKPQLKPHAASLTQLPAPSDRTTAGDARESLWLLDLGFAQVPSSRIELATPATDFVRRVMLESSNDNERWSTVSNGEISDIKAGRKRVRNLQLSYPETQARYLRLRVFNLDDRPLAFTSARVLGQTRHVLFRYAANEQYRLCYGNEKAVAPQYDLERVQAFLRLSELPQFTLQPERANPLYQTSAPAAPMVAGSPYWVWGILTVAALALGGFIFRLTKMSAE